MMTVKNRLTASHVLSFYKNKRGLEKENEILEKNGKAKIAIKIEGLSDGGNLRLQYNKSGTFHWRHGFRLFGKSKTKTIGSYPEMSLARAREVRDENNVKIKQSIDPIHKTLNARTFREVAKLWHEFNCSKWKENHAKDVWRNLENNIFKHIGDTVIDDITPSLLKNILKKKEQEGKLETLKKLRQWCNNIFIYAQAEEITTNNPTAMLSAVLKSPPAKKPFNSIKLEDLPHFIKTLNNYNGDAVTIAAIKLVMLTLLRTQELVRGKWIEIDFDKKIWTVPAQRMKWYRRKGNFMNMDFIVPLSEQSILILKELYKDTGSYEYIFARTKRPRNKPISDGTMYGALRTHMKFKGKMTVHGFRHFASTQLYGMTKSDGNMYEARVIERQLSHQIGNEVSQTYNKAEYLPQRREMMQDWADFIDKNC